MNLRIILNNKHDLIRATRTLEELPFDPVHSVTIKEHKETRSAAQNRLLWSWNTQYANHLGEDKETIHNRMKEKHAIPIFIRDSEEYAAMVEAVKNVRRQGMSTDADQLRKWIVEHTSTTDFDTKQMAEYLTEVERDAAEKGCPLSHPEDLYYRSMGVL